MTRRFHKADADGLPVFSLNAQLSSVNGSGCLRGTTTFYNHIYFVCIYIYIYIHTVYTLVHTQPLKRLERGTLYIYMSR